MKDIVLLALVVGSFAGALTCHVTLLVGLFRRAPRSRGLFALLLPPLAPYWGFRERLRVRAGGWVIFVALYLVGLIAAR